MDIVLRLALGAGLVWLLVRYPAARRLAWTAMGVGAALFVAGVNLLILAIPAILSAAFMILVLFGRQHPTSTALALMAMDEQ